jgi:hypothetical protein
VRCYIPSHPSPGLYYAAQLGLSLKPASPTFLFTLLDLLETRKKEIGPNDAVDIDAASIAFVENFALRIFSSADEEDRKGEGNRSTAKKFLAAANFLEVLSIFPTGEVSESVSYISYCLTCRLFAALNRSRRRYGTLNGKQQT